MENPFEIVETTFLTDEEQTKDITEISTEAPKIEGVEEVDLSTQRGGKAQDPNPTVVIDNPENPKTLGDASDGVEAGSEEDVPGINAYYAAQLHLAEQGFLDKDSVKEDATWEDVENAFEKKVTAKIQQSVAKKLEAQGVNEQTLMYARMIQNNQSVEEANSLHQLGRIAALKDVPDLTEEQQVAVIANMYGMNNYDQEAISLIVDKRKSENKLNEEYKKALQFHESKYQEGLSVQKEEQAQRTTQIEKEQAEKTAKVENILKSNQILGVQIPKTISGKLVNEIYNQDTEYSYGGEKKVGSKLDAFLADFYNDPEKILLTYLRHTYPEEFKTSTQSKAKSDIEKQLTKALETRTEKDVKEDIPSIHWEEAN
jgi:hypothetical protein